MVLGVSDWEYTEVVEGLAPGDRVVQVSIAQLQMQQQEMSDRFRQRFGGPLGTGGGGSRGGGSTGSGGSGGGGAGGGRPGSGGSGAGAAPRSN